MLSSTDRNTWALCLWREARGEGYAGMRAVAWVIRNRTHAWGKTVRDVIVGHTPDGVPILENRQFTSMVEQKLADGSWGFEHPPDADPQWEEAQRIVALIDEGADVEDITNGALYYANLVTATSGWFFEHIVKSAAHPRTAVIGHHTFFK